MHEVWVYRKPTSMACRSARKSAFGALLPTYERLDRLTLSSEWHLMSRESDYATVLLPVAPAVLRPCPSILENNYQVPETLLLVHPVSPSQDNIQLVSYFELIDFSLACTMVVFSFPSQPRHSSPPPSMPIAYVRSLFSYNKHISKAALTHTICTPPPKSRGTSLSILFPSGGAFTNTAR